MNSLASELVSGAMIVFSGHFPGSDAAGARRPPVFKAFEVHFHLAPQRGGARQPSAVPRLTFRSAWAALAPGRHRPPVVSPSARFP